MFPFIGIQKERVDEKKPKKRKEEEKRENGEKKEIELRRENKNVLH